MHGTDGEHKTVVSVVVRMCRVIYLIVFLVALVAAQLHVGMVDSQSVSESCCDWSLSESCDWSPSVVTDWDSSNLSDLESCEWSEGESSGPERYEQLCLSKRTPTLLLLLCDWSETSCDTASSRSQPLSLVRHAETSALRWSPRTLKPSNKATLAISQKIDFGNEGWQLSAVMKLNGCSENCTSEVHGLTEFDVLLAHSTFYCKSYAEQRQWLLDYFLSHCPNGSLGEKEPRNMQYLLCGRVVCQRVWLTTLSISTSRFYEIRKDFMGGIVITEAEKRSRSLAPKSLEAIAWMKTYFERIGDKRPDKDGIYLPTCLTEKMIYDTMVEDVYSGKQSSAVCFSQFNKIYRQHFPNVTIPKVSNIQPIWKCRILQNLCKTMCKTSVFVVYKGFCGQESSSEGWSFKFVILTSMQTLFDAYLAVLRS